MSLNLRLLEKVRELGNGIVQARCPACAENGQDKAGEHLRVYPDGRFGCCVHPKDRQHRRRIFALAGDKSPRSFTIKVASGKPAAEPARPITASLTTFLGTVGTPVSDLVSGEPNFQEEFGTVGTPISMPCAYAIEKEGDHMHTCKDIDSGVPNVPDPPRARRLPYLTPGGVLGIPFDSPERFHWWNGGQSVAETQAEVERWIYLSRLIRHYRLLRLGCAFNGHVYTCTFQLYRTLLFHRFLHLSVVLHNFGHELRIGL